MISKQTPPFPEYDSIFLQIDHKKKGKSKFPLFLMQNVRLQTAISESGIRFLLQCIEPDIFILPADLDEILPFCIIGSIVVRPCADCVRIIQTEHFHRLCVIAVPADSFILPADNEFE